jgi:hypothetical protein
MRSDKPCKYCERITVNVELGRAIESMSDIPNTLDPATGRYCWRTHDVISYALIPRAIQRHVGQVDCYVCADDDDLAEINLEAYVRRFFNETVLPQWKSLKGTYASQPVPAPPEGVECRRVRNSSHGMTTA